jgi:hypothetical protein
MGSRDKEDGTQPGSDLISADASEEVDTFTTPDEEEGQQESETVDVNGAWATAEGYSPLTDLQGGGALFNAGPSYNGNDNDDNDEDEGEDNGVSSSRGAFFASHAGAFFADMAAFGPIGDGDGDDDWGDDANDNNDNNNANDNNNDGDDFRQVAERALMALDDDYQTTLQGASRKTALELSARPDAAVLPPSDEDARFAATLFATCKKEMDATDMAEVGVDSKRPASTVSQQLPDIDTDAVRRAVQAIGLGNPKFQSNLTQWEESQKRASAAVPPRTHPLIPSVALKAFRKSTEKAIQATGNLTRSACIAQALHRLDILSNRSRTTSQANNDDHHHDSGTLILHVIGCDHVECESVERIQHWFGFLARWIGAQANTNADTPRHLEIHLVGPNVPAHAAARPAVDLLALSSTAATALASYQTATDSRLETARAMSHVGVYNEWMVDRQKADLVIAFNAGIWGYNEWLPTLEHLIRAKQSIPLVVTAYTLQEAEDDFDVIQEQVVALSSVEHAKECCLWPFEVNALASKVPRETATARSHLYRENGAWQAWRL